MGMYNGAISKHDITCDHEDHVGSPTHPNCASCKDARSKVDVKPHSQYWCIDFTQRDNATIEFSFPFSTFVSYMTIDVLNSDHTYGYLTYATARTKAPNEYHYRIRNSQIEKINYNWRLPRLTIAGRINHLQVTFHLGNKDMAALRFEFYGCPFYTYAQPLGMMNKQFQPGQFLANYGDLNTLDNPWGARLLSAEAGWRILNSVPNTEANPDNFYFRLNLKENYKIVFLEYQMLKTDANVDQDMLSFFVKYGLEENDLRFYADPDNPNPEQRTITPIAHHIEGVLLRAVFKYPLHTRIFQLHPLNCHVNCRNIKFELHGVKEEVADHAWNFMRATTKGSSDYDSHMFSILQSKNSARATANNYVLTTAKEGYYAKHVPILGMDSYKDCLLNPNLCEDGFSVSFWSKYEFDNSPYGKGYGRYTNITQMVNGECLSIDGANAEEYQNTVKFTYDQPFGVRFKKEAIRAFVKIDSASIPLHGTSGKLFYLFAEYYLNPPSKLINDCQFFNTALQPVYKGILQARLQVYPNKPRGLDIWHHMKHIVNIPLWRESNELAIIFRPPPSDLFGPAGEAIDFSANTDSKETKPGISYAPRVCSFHKEDIVKNLPASSFNVSYPCSTPAENVRFGEVGLEICGEGEEILVNKKWIFTYNLTIDLKEFYSITMIKISDAEDPERLDQLSSFNLLYSTDGIHFQDHHEKKESIRRSDGPQGKTEYITLGHPILRARWLRIIPVGKAYIETPTLHFDIVTCLDAPDERERDWVFLGNVTIGATGKTPGMIHLTEHNGLDISHFKLVHQDGIFHIGLSDPTIYSIRDNENGIIVTTNLSTPLDETTFYAPSNLKPSLQSEIWPYPGLREDTKEIMLRNKLPFFVRQYEHIFFWHGEDFYDRHTHDNTGTITVDVYALAKSVPGSYIMILDDDKHPCLGIDDSDGKTVVANEKCKDMFYFDNAGHMIHLNSGRCIKKDGAGGLVADTDSCDQKFTGDGKGEIETSYPDSKCITATNHAPVVVSGAACSTSTTQYEFLVYKDKEYDYKEFEQRFYKLPAQNLKYKDAKEECKKYGLELPMLKTQYELDMWKKLVSDHSLQTSYNMGTHRKDFVDQYVWDDGTPNDMAPTSGSTRCQKVLSGASLADKNCGSAETNIICQVPGRRFMNYSDIISSNFLRQRRLSFGSNGFNIAMTNTSEFHALFQVNVAGKYGRLTLNISNRLIWNHLGFVFNKKENAILAHANGKIAGKSYLAEALLPRPRNYKYNRILLFGQLQYIKSSLNQHSMSELRMWRYPLHGDVFQRMTTSVTYDFSELHWTAMETFKYNFSSVCSDPQQLTGPCNDISTINLQRDLHASTIGVVPRCEWWSGRGEDIIVDHGKSLSKEECLQTCYDVTSNYSQASSKVNGVSFGVTPTRQSTYGKCLCIFSHGALVNTTNDDASYKTCVFPLPVYYGLVTNGGTVLQIAFTPNREWIYAIGLNFKLHYLNTVTSVWESKPYDCQQVEVDPSYKKWFRHNNIIKDESGLEYSSADCDSFVVDDQFLGCRKTSKEVYIRSKVFEKSNWTLLTDGATQVRVAVDGRWYIYDDSTKDIAEVKRATGEKQIVANALAGGFITFFQSFDVTPSQKVVIATNMGVFLYIGNNGWVEINNDKDTYYVRAIDDYYAYVLEDGVPRPKQIPLGRIQLPGYSLIPQIEANYELARESCQDQGGDVISNFNTTQDFAAAYHMVDKAGQAFFWFGAKDPNTDSDRKFYQLNGNMLIHAPWGVPVELANPAEQCVIYKKEYFGDAPCEFTAGTGASSQCQVPVIPWLRTELPVEVSLVKTPTSCQTVNDGIVEIPKVDGTNGNSATFIFSRTNITQDMTIKNAFLKFYTSEDSDVNSDVISYLIGLLYRPYDSIDCNDLDDISNQELIIPILWNVSAEWRTTKPVVSPDISKLINFLVRKKTWNSESTFQILLTPLSTSIQSTRKILINQTELVLNYENNFPNRYMLKKSIFSPVPSIDTVIIGPFHPNIQTVSFWIHMKGPHCGNLFVWTNGNLMMQLSEELADDWKHLWIDVRGNNGEPTEIMFVSINNQGSKGHFAFDHFVGYPHADLAVHGDEVATYDSKNKTFYIGLLEEFGIPIPKVMYPFQKDAGDQDFGLFGLNLAWHKARLINEEKYYGTDKYDFLRHMFYYGAQTERGKQPWAYIYNEDMTPFTSLVDTSSSFTFVTHLKYDDLQLGFVQDKMQYVRANGTIFMFQNEKTKLTVRDYPEGIAVRVHNSSGHPVVERFIPIRKHHVYFAISYQNGYGSVYLDDELRTTFQVDHAILTPFPKKLIFFFDPDDEFELPITATKADSEKQQQTIRNVRFRGSISCFQAFDQALTLQQIKQVEFCPNRQGRIYHRKSCEDGGEKIIFNANCVCQDYNNRYITRTCRSALKDTVYENALEYLPFDIPNKIKGVKNVMDLTTTNPQVQFTSGPVNTGICVNGDVAVQIGTMSSSCLETLTGTCDSGYAIAVWLFVGEHYFDETIEVFRFNEFSVEVVFESDESKINQTFNFKMAGCGTLSKVIGIRTVHQYTVIIASAKANYQLYIDAEYIGEESCTGSGPWPATQTLTVGGASRVCIDDFAISTSATMNFPENFYTSLVKGTFSSDPQVLGLKTQISIPEILVTGPTSDDYLEMFQDTSSESSQILIETINEIIMQKISYLLPNFYSVQVNKLSYGRENMVRAENVLINFQTLSLAELQVFEDCPIKLTYNGKDLEINCDGMKPVYGLSQIEVEGVGVTQYKAEVRVVNRLPIHDSYHLGFKIRLEAITEYGNGTVQEETHYTGVGTFPFDVELGKRYNATVWAITHEGVGVGTTHEFISLGDYPHYPPNATAYNTSLTSLNVSIDNFPEDLWNDIEIWYLLYYKEFDNDPEKDNNITAYTEVRIDRDPNREMNHTYAIEGLAIFTNYSILVRVANVNGEGPLFNLSCYTKESTPEAPPELAALTPVDNRLEIKWNYTDDIHIWNDFTLEKFGITLTSVFPQNTKIDGPFTYFVSPDTFTQLSDELDYFRVYRITLTTHTKSGPGPTVDFCQVTNSYYPQGRPQTVDILGVDRTSMNFSIGQVDVTEEGGVIMNYTITYTSVDWPDTLHTIVTDSIIHSEANWNIWNSYSSFPPTGCADLPPSSVLMGYNLQDLTPNTNYSFSVIACNQYGCGQTDNVTTVVYGQTLPDIPSCFPNITLVANTSSESIRVEWSHLTHFCGYGNLVQYHIGVLDDDLYQEWIQNKSMIDLDLAPTVTQTTENFTEFDGLKNYWKYSVFVIYENVVGKGPISDLFSTFTAEDVPTSAPFLVTSEAFNSSALSINITIPIRENRNGIIIGYQVTLVNEIEETFKKNYSVAHLIQWNNTEPSGDDILTSVLFGDLKAYFNHTVTVQAFTKVGLGPSSEPFISRTGQSVPTAPPSNISYSHVTPNSSVIGWMHIPYLNRHGVPSSFILNASGILANGTLDSLGPFNVSAHPDTPEFDFMIENLFPKTIYNVTLIGCTRIGCGPPTGITFETLEMAPSSFPLQITNVNNTEMEKLLVQWSDILSMDKRGIITHYYIQFTKINHTWDTVDSLPKLQIVRLSSNDNDSMTTYDRTEIVPLEGHFILDEELFYSTWLTGLGDLENYTDYKISIAGKTSAGVGPYSPEFVFRTVENVPSFYPVINSTGEVSAFEVFVRFPNLTRPYHQGVLLGYKVYYQEIDLIQDCIDGGYHFPTNCSLRMSSINKTIIELETPEIDLFAPPPIPGEEDEIDENLYEMILFDLLPGVNYTVCLTAFTVAGVGPEYCTWARTEDAIHGNWTDWTDWGNCDQTCGQGIQMRYRWCINPVPDNGGDYCVGDGNETRWCNEIPCDGYYLANSYTNCNQTCSSVSEDFLCIPTFTPFTRDLHNFPRDPNHYNRTIEVTCEPTHNNHSQSIHPSFDMTDKSCQGFEHPPKMIDCASKPDSPTDRRLCYCGDEDVMNFLEWGLWSPCTKSCAIGTRKRSRECAVDDEARFCPEEKMSDTQDCNAFPCPINGQWGNWTDFGACTVACGFGRRYRQRECNNPKPALGGEDCPFGVVVDFLEGCNAYPCPIHGGWGAWYEIEECTQPCGLGGVKRQRRYCNSPLPQYDGRPCNGPSERFYKCNEHIVCENELAITYKLRFINETWDYRLVYDNTNEFRDFSTRLTDNINLLHSNNSDKIKDTILDVTCNKLERGSVIANFTIRYWEISSAQIVLMQHAIEEDKFINDMPLQKINISSDQVPSMLLHATAQSYSPFSINVTWSDLNVNTSELYLYYIFWRQLAVEPATWSVKGFNNTGPNQLIDLLPATWYGIRISASFQSGNGIATEEIKVITLEGAPYIGPPNMTADINGQTSVFISWLPISSSQVPGNLLGYRLRYKLYHDSRNQSQVITLDAFTHNRMLTGLKAFSYYWIEVVGFTNAGEGPHSLVVIKTPPGPPAIAPPNATMSDKYHINEIKVQWDAIPRELENGRISGYKVTWELHQKFGRDVPVNEETVPEEAFDRFTLGYTIKGLHANSIYKVSLFGYSPQGDGPKHVEYVSTCKCPPIIYNNFFNSQPYIDYNKKLIEMAGLFPHLLQMIITNVCTDTCNSYNHSVIYYDRTSSGDPSSKKNEVGVRKKIGQSAHMNFPIQGLVSMKKFQGDHPFVSLVPFQGTAFVVFHEAVKSVGFIGLFKAVFNAWAVVVISCLMAWLCGCVYWFTEQTSETSEINLQSALIGQIQGFWISFITMTTVGYGDINPSTFPSKVLMILWALIGLVVFGLTMGVIGSGLVVNTQPATLKIYGTPTAVIEGTFENRLAIYRNADLTHNKTYEDVLSVLQDVADKKIELALIDANSLAGYENEMKRLSLAIGKIYVTESCFGVVLTDGFEAMEDDVRSFVMSQSAEISAFISSKVAQLEPYSLEVEEKILTDEEFNSLFVNCGILLIVLSFFGMLHTLRLHLKSKSEVHPEDHEDSEFILSEIESLVDDFNESFESKVEGLENRHTTELQHLASLHQNYKRLLLRKGFEKGKVVHALENTHQKAAHKIVKVKTKEKYERILKKQEYFNMKEQEEK
ncbi:uncharacterized protein [Clytia hemisphaerica]